MSDLPAVIEVFDAYKRAGLCAEFETWLLAQPSPETALDGLSAEWFLFGAQHYVRSSASSIEEGAAAVEDVLKVITLRPVSGHVMGLITNVRARLAAPCSNDIAKRSRLASAFGALVGIWSSIGKPVELEPLMVAKLRAYVDFGKLVAVTKK